MGGITTDTIDQLIIGCIGTAKPDIGGGTAEMSAITNSNLTSITERQDDAAASGNGGWIGAWTGIEATSGQSIGATTWTKATASYKAQLVIAIRDSAPASAITFEASIAGVGALTVADVIQLSLGVSVAGLGTVAIDAVRQRALEVSIAGTGALTSDVVVQRALEVAIAGQGVLAVEFANVKLLNVDVAGTGAVVADFVRQIGLEAAVAGLGAVTVDTALQKSLEVAVAGSGAVSADFVRQIGLEVIVAGVSQVLAEFVKDPVVFQAAIAGNGTVIVDVTVTGAEGEVLIVRTLLGVGL
jgi:hypothetical protein